MELKDKIQELVKAKHNEVIDIKINDSEICKQYTYCKMRLKIDPVNILFFIRCYIPACTGCVQSEQNSFVAIL